MSCHTLATSLHTVSRRLHTVSRRLHTRLDAARFRYAIEMTLPAPISGSSTAGMIKELEGSSSDQKAFLLEGL